MTISQLPRLKYTCQKYSSVYFFEHFKQHRTYFKSTNIVVYAGKVIQCNFDLLSIRNTVRISLLQVSSVVNNYEEVIFDAGR